jgi:hypothetical protein
MVPEGGAALLSGIKSPVQMLPESGVTLLNGIESPAQMVPESIESLDQTGVDGVQTTVHVIS